MPLGYAQGADAGTALCYWRRHLDPENFFLIFRHEDAGSGLREQGRVVEINLQKLNHHFIANWENLRFSSRWFKFVNSLKWI